MRSADQCMAYTMGTETAAKQARSRRAARTSAIDATKKVSSFAHKEDSSIAFIVLGGWVYAQQRCGGRGSLLNRRWASTWRCCRPTRFSPAKRQLALLLCWAQNLERAHQAFVDAHESAGVIELPCGEY